MSLDNFVAIGTFIISCIAIFLSLRKQKHDENNIDADTITKLYATIDKQECMYKELKKEFEDYKKITNAQIASLVAENAELRMKLSYYTKDKGE